MDKRFYWGLGIILCIVIGISFTPLLMVMVPLLFYFTYRFFKREVIKEPHKPGRKKGSGKGRANYSHKPIKTPLHDGENKK